MEPTNMSKTSVTTVYSSVQEAGGAVDDAYTPLHTWYEPLHRATDIAAAALLLTALRRPLHWLPCWSS